MWVARQADDSFVCFGAKPDKGFLDLKSRRDWSGKGTREESRTKELTLVGDGTRTEAVDTGHRSREASQHEIGSSKEDRVKMSAFQLLCGIFASNPR